MSPVDVRQAVTAAVTWVKRFKTADALAAALRKQGVRGLRSNYVSCPLARFVRQRFAPDCRVCVSSYITIDTAGGGTMSSARERLPEVGRRFLCTFDNGRYPHLNSHMRGKA